MSAPGFPNVIVVGAGPAGSLAAALLARGGLEVTLIEQSRFPRDKVCGECLSDQGLRALAGAGLVGLIDSLRPVALGQARFVAAGGEGVELDLPSPMLGITRGAIDTAFLEAARSTGVLLLQPERVERVALTGGRPALVVRDLQTNQTRRLEADLVLLADGKSALLGAKPRATGELGIKAHFDAANADPRTISLFGLHGHYLGLAPVSDGNRVIWNLAAAVPVARVREFGGDHQALLAALRRENAGLDQALAGATRVSPWLACPLPRFAMRKHWPTGVIPLGNSAAALEPIGGEGMGLAIASAALAASFVLEGRTSPGDLDELRRQYSRLWQRRRLIWRALAMLLSRPRLARLAIAAANLAPSLAAGAAALLQATAPPARVDVSRRRASVLS